MLVIGSLVIVSLVIGCMVIGCLASRWGITPKRWVV